MIMVVGGGREKLLLSEGKKPAVKNGPWYVL